MFDTLSDRLQATLGDLGRTKRLDEDAVNKAMREIRLALLEADVNFQVVKDFVAGVKEPLSYRIEPLHNLFAPDMDMIGRIGSSSVPVGKVQALRAS